MRALLVVTIVYSLLFLLGASWIFVLDAYAFDYYQTSDFVWDEAPIVCINNPPDYKTYWGLKGVTEWRDRLPPGFDFRVLVGYHEVCNVNIELVNTIPSNNDIGPVGQTSCQYDSDKYVQDDIIFYLNTTNWCNVKIKDARNDYGDTIKHEMGHVLGIGHRTIYNGTDIGKLVMTGDIMLNQIFGVQKIQPEALEGLKLIYGENGYEPPNRYDIITIKVIHD